jgi:hypothetical protein
VLSILTVFVSITKPRCSYKLLLNFRGGTFCEIPLRNKDVEIAKMLTQKFLNKV